MPPGRGSHLPPNVTCCAPSSCPALLIGSSFNNPAFSCPHHRPLEAAGQHRRPSGGRGCRLLLLSRGRLLQCSHLLAARLPTCCFLVRDQPPFAAARCQTETRRTFGAAAPPRFEAGAVFSGPISWPLVFERRSGRVLAFRWPVPG